MLQINLMDSQPLKQKTTQIKIQQIYLFILTEYKTLLPVAVNLIDFFFLAFKACAPPHHIHSAL